MKLTNHPAPPEATGWECDKLDPRGVEDHFAAYIGRLARGSLRDGLMRGVIVDSWECLRQTWTWKIEEAFEKYNGYSPRPMLPALWGTIITSEEETNRFLLDWRRTIGRLTAENYYGRMSELAHEAGLDIAYETALGDATIGDPLEYWKYCDTPMCEYWRSSRTTEAGVGHPNFKPVRPCVSAAHLYGKRRVAAEAFTDMQLDWAESLRELKARAVAHFARGVTHTVTHTYTHNPCVDSKPPGTSFGSTIGSPFLRGQTWWSFVPQFTQWLATCCEFLERGKAVVDVLRYIGDDVPPRPDELEYIPEGFTCDFLNPDALYTRLDVRDGKFVLPDGMSYSRLWVPHGTFLLPKTRECLRSLSDKGGKVVVGTIEEAVKGLVPQVVSEPEEAAGDILWYHRLDGDAEGYFLAANTNGFRGKIKLRTQCGVRETWLNLAASETRFVTVHKDGRLEGLAEPCCFRELRTVDGFALSFPSGWGVASDSIALTALVPWKDLPGLSEEGRAFSGTASYTTILPIPEDHARLFLDLGCVRECARVFVNDRLVAELWAEPYRCEIGQYVHPGENTLRIQVTSTWLNRLVYDSRQPVSDRKTWTVWNTVREDQPRDSGLMGPVRLLIPELTHGAGAKNDAFTERCY